MCCWHLGNAPSHTNLVQPGFSHPTHRRRGLLIFPAAAKGAVQPANVRSARAPCQSQAAKARGGGKLAAAVCGKPNVNDKRGGSSLVSVPRAALLLPTAEYLQHSPSPGAPSPFPGNPPVDKKTLKTTHSVSDSLTCSPFTPFSPPALLEPSGSSSSTIYFGTQGSSQPTHSAQTRGW